MVEHHRQDVGTKLLCFSGTLAVVKWYDPLAVVIAEEQSIGLSTRGFQGLVRTASKNHSGPNVNSK